MTKRIPVRKNMTRNREQDAEEESSASEGERETVGKPTGKTPDMQNVRDVTETVMEKRTMEEIPPSTWVSGSPYFLLLFVFAPLM